MTNHSESAGFTLIELSIVLVIVGLIIGGVVVGRDLIETSRYRATVKQIEQFNSAANAFKLKYNCLPGDCANATTLGFTASTTAYNVCGPNVNGNGDGLIDANGGEGVSENCYFFELLSQAGLIASNPPPMPIDVYVSTGNYPSLNGWWINYWPELTMYDGNPNTLADLSPYFYSITQGFYSNPARAMRPAPAYYIDNKLDDGFPLSGQIRAYDANINGLGWYQNGYTVSTGNPKTGPVCLDNTQTPVQYSTTSSAFLCALAIKASF
jgi:prepilin-type N-terminal cleavage/methylation domain-containing protein